MLSNYFGDERSERGSLGRQEDAKDGGDVPPRWKISRDEWQNLKEW